MEIRSIRDIVDYCADTYKDAPAYRYKVKKDVVEKSFKEVKRDSMAVSRFVADLSLEGKHIAVLGPTSYPWIISYFGITGSQSVAVPIDAQLSADDICAKHMLYCGFIETNV